MFKIMIFLSMLLSLSSVIFAADSEQPDLLARMRARQQWPPWSLQEVPLALTSRLDSWSQEYSNCFSDYISLKYTGTWVGTSNITYNLIEARLLNDPEYARSFTVVEICRNQKIAGMSYVRPQFVQPFQSSDLIEIAAIAETDVIKLPLCPHIEQLDNVPLCDVIVALGRIFDRFKHEGRYKALPPVISKAEQPEEQDKSPEVPPKKEKSECCAIS